MSLQCQYLNCTLLRAASGSLPCCRPWFFFREIFATFVLRPPSASTPDPLHFAKDSGIRPEWTESCLFLMRQSLPVPVEEKAGVRQTKPAFQGVLSSTCMFTNVPLVIRLFCFKYHFVSRCHSYFFNFENRFQYLWQVEKQDINFTKYYNKKHFFFPGSGSNPFQHLEKSAVLQEVYPDLYFYSLVVCRSLN